jgi:hypothetical protein
MLRGVVRWLRSAWERLMRDDPDDDPDDRWYW